MRRKTVLSPGMHRGFRRGMDRATRSVVMSDYMELKKELSRLIGGTRCKMTYYVNGQTIIREDTAREIERIFARRGIAAKDLWDT